MPLALHCIFQDLVISIHYIPLFFSRLVNLIGRESLPFLLIMGISKLSRAYLVMVTISQSRVWPDSMYWQ